MIEFRLGGQIAANIEAQNQMLFDAMTPEEQQRVLAAQAKRDADFTVLVQQKMRQIEQSFWYRLWCKLKPPPTIW